MQTSKDKNKELHHYHHHQAKIQKLTIIGEQDDEE